jgi:hypothetical protein
MIVAPGFGKLRVMAEALTITREKLAHVFDLQGRAYETLLWLSNIAFARPHMLTRETADTLRNTRGCLAWVEQHRGQLPQHLRPAADEAEAFARLFSSFFQTSFRIEQRIHDRRPYYRIMPNKDKAGGRGRLGVRNVPRVVRRKRRSEVERLQINALQDLPMDRAEAIESVLNEEPLRDDLLVWTYAVELVRRSMTDSHGPAVHELWRRMPADRRRHLTADRIWHARERLVDALRLHAARSQAKPIRTTTGD